MKKMEAASGIEPLNRGFADLSERTLRGVIQLLTADLEGVFGGPTIHRYDLRSFFIHQFGHGLGKVAALRVEV